MYKVLNMYLLLIVVWFVIINTECQSTAFTSTASQRPSISVSCPSEIVGTPEALGIFTWPKTEVGKRATIACPYEPKAFATRECLSNITKPKESSWGSIHAELCPYKNKWSQQILHISKKVVNSSNVILVAKQITNLTFPGEKLIPDDVVHLASILENIVAVKEKADEIFDNVFDTVDNILDTQLKVVMSGQRKTNSSLRIVQSLNTLLETLDITKEGFLQKTLRNYAVDLSIINPHSFRGLTFSGIVTRNTSARLNEEILIKKTSGNKSQPKATMIHLPPMLFNDNVDVNFSQPQTVILALYKETKFFKTSSSNISQRLNSFVIAGSIKGVSVSNLKSPVVLTYLNVKPADKNSTFCGFLNFTKKRWSHEGCVFQGIDVDGRVICHCDHLTNFAMLMDIYADNETSHEAVLGIISYIGCALSLVGLLLTIITILLFKDLRRKVPNQILLNFCIALSLTLVVFLSAAERSKTFSMESCRVAAVALHYLVLVVFMWMAIEAFNMYLAFVKVLPSYIPRFILKCCFIAWGIPLVIVSITVGVALDDYGDTKYCRLNGLAFLVSFLAPALIILLGNAIAFVLIFRSLLTSGSNITADRKMKGYQHARQGAAILVLLGLTWLFGVLAINEARVIFQYLFCIFNSLQGFLVFVFYCLLPSATRKMFRHSVQKMANGSGKKNKAELKVSNMNSPHKEQTKDNKKVNNESPSILELIEVKNP